MNIISRFGILLLCIFQSVKSDIYIEKITGNNIRKLQNEGKFMMMFVTKVGCDECSQVYPKFISASQSFDQDEIMFGRIEHTGLAAKLGVETFPSLLYCKANSKNIKRTEIDITVDAIVEFIANITKKHITSLDKHYTVELTIGNFNDITKIPKQFKLLLLYSPGNKDNREKVEFIERFAKKYRNDDIIIFCRLNVKKETYLKGRFKAIEYPVLYWYSNDEVPEMFIYGGEFQEEELSKFLSDSTGIKRQKEGSLTEEAGILKDYEKLFILNEQNILKGEKLKSVIKEAKGWIDLYEGIDNKMAEYYTYLLEEVAWHENTSIFDDEHYYLLYELNKGTYGSKQKELLLRKQNVINSIFNLFKGKLLRRNSKDSPLIMKKEPRPHKHEKIMHHEEF